MYDSKWKFWGIFFFILCIMILRSVFFIFAIFNRIFQSFQLKVDNSFKSWKKKKMIKKIEKNFALLFRQDWYFQTFFALLYEKRNRD